MRIVSGNAGGIRLRVPRGRAVRPTADRTKEAVFAALGDLRDCVVVDLFAGSGALGLEALSRGASRVVFVEHNAAAAGCIQANITAVARAMRLENPPARLLRCDVRGIARTLPELAGRIDLILADPPYRPRPGEYGAEALLKDHAFSTWAGTALLLLEHATDTPLPCAPQSPWKLLRQQQFGTQTVSWCKQTDKTERTTKSTRNPA